MRDVVQAVVVFLVARTRRSRGLMTIRIIVVLRVERSWERYIELILSVLRGATK